MPNIQIVILVSNSGTIMWISYWTKIVVAMIFLIATMEASTWLISSTGNPKDFEWLRNRTKPTARQISISKSLTESMVKQNLCWTGHFIPPPPTENVSIEWPVQVNPWKKHNFHWKGSLVWKGSQNWSSRTPFTLRTPFKGNLVKNRIYVGLATLYPLPQQRMPL